MPRRTINKNFCCYPTTTDPQDINWWSLPCGCCKCPCSCTKCKPQCLKSVCGDASNANLKPLRKPKAKKQKKGTTVETEPNTLQEHTHQNENLSKLVEPSLKSSADDNRIDQTVMSSGDVVDVTTPTSQEQRHDEHVSEVNVMADSTKPSADDNHIDQAVMSSSDVVDGTAQKSQEQHHDESMSEVNVMEDSTKPSADDNRSDLTVMSSSDVVSVSAPTSEEQDRCHDESMSEAIASKNGMESSADDNRIDETVMSSVDVVSVTAPTSEEQDRHHDESMSVAIASKNGTESSADDNCIDETVMSSSDVVSVTAPTSEEQDRRHDESMSVAIASKNGTESSADDNCIDETVMSSVDVVSVTAPTSEEQDRHHDESMSVAIASKNGTESSADDHCIDETVMSSSDVVSVTAPTSEEQDRRHDESMSEAIVSKNGTESSADDNRIDLTVMSSVDVIDVTAPTSDEQDRRHDESMSEAIASKNGTESSADDNRIDLTVMSSVDVVSVTAPTSEEQDRCHDESMSVAIASKNGTESTADDKGVINQTDIDASGGSVVVPLNALNHKLVELRKKALVGIPMDYNVAKEDDNEVTIRDMDLKDRINAADAPKVSKDVLAFLSLKFNDAHANGANEVAFGDIFRMSREHCERGHMVTLVDEYLIMGSTVEFEKDHRDVFVHAVKATEELTVSAKKSRKKEAAPVEGKTIFKYSDIAIPSDSVQNMMQEATFEVFSLSAEKSFAFSRTDLSKKLEKITYKVPRASTRKRSQVEDCYLIRATSSQTTSRGGRSFTLRSSIVEDDGRCKDSSDPPAKLLKENEKLKKNLKEVENSLQKKTEQLQEEKSSRTAENKVSRSNQKRLERLLEERDNDVARMSKKQKLEEETAKKNVQSNESEKDIAEAVRAAEHSRWLDRENMILKRDTIRAESERKNKEEEHKRTMELVNFIQNGSQSTHVVAMDKSIQLVGSIIPQGVLPQSSVSTPNVMTRQAGALLDNSNVPNRQLSVYCTPDHSPGASPAVNFNHGNTVDMMMPPFPHDERGANFMNNFVGRSSSSSSMHHPYQRNYDSVGISAVSWQKSNQDQFGLPPPVPFPNLASPSVDPHAAGNDLTYTYSECESILKKNLPFVMKSPDPVSQDMLNLPALVSIFLTKLGCEALTARCNSVKHPVAKANIIIKEKGFDFV